MARSLGDHICKRVGVISTPGDYALTLALTLTLTLAP